VQAIELLNVTENGKIDTVKQQGGQSAQASEGGY
jgi:hypothetical protein